MDTNILKSCLQLVKKGKFLYSPYHGRELWSLEDSFYLQSKPMSMLYFIRDKIARLIQYMCFGLKNCSLDADCIVMDVPYENFMEQLVTHAGQVLSTSSIGGIMASSYIGDDCPQVDNFFEHLCHKSVHYMYNLSNFISGMGHEFFISENDLLDVLDEENYYEAENEKVLISLLTDDDLERLYGLFMGMSIYETCSFDTFRLLARETGYLFNTLYNPFQYHTDNGMFCVHILHDYQSVMNYCNKHHDRLTGEEALLWDIIQTFEEKGLAHTYMIDYEDDSTILSDGSKAYYQNFNDYPSPYTGENIYFGLYMNSFSVLSGLLKERYSEMEGGSVA